MFTLNGCTVLLPDGTTSRRQRIVIEDNVLSSFDKRTGKLKIQLAIQDFTVVSKNRVTIETADGPILVTKSGCGCGR